jgi:hypothetical protein
MHRATSLLALPLLLLGCPTSSDSNLPSCSAPDELEVGTVEATLDGDPWTGTSSGYQLAATGFFFAANAAPLSLSLRVTRSSVYGEDEEGNVVIDEGDSVEDIFDEAAFPADLAFGSTNDDGADATPVLDGETFHTSEGGSGFGTLLELVEDPPHLRGCFELIAGSTSGDDELTLSGAFALAAM